MAKNVIVLIYFCILGFSIPGCVLKNGVETQTDTDSVLSHSVSIDNAIQSFPSDTISETIKIAVDLTSDTLKVDTVKTIVLIPDDNYRIRLQTLYNSQIGIREATGNNDGKEVEEFLASVGLKKGNPYCAAFVHYDLNKVGVKNSITGYSPTAFNLKKAVWFQNKLIREPRPGDVITLYFPSKGRIAHTGFYDRRINSIVLESVEANTNVEGSREGDGVYRKKRSFKATYGITDFIQDKQ